MSKHSKNVIVVVGGVAGLSAAIGLAHFGMNVKVLDKTKDLGDHARQFNCKALNPRILSGSYPFM